MDEFIPKVSIAVPVFNVEKYIERCARSLFNQTYERIEYIFIDDCTPDSSIDILKRVIEYYPQRKPFVKIVMHEKNRGLAAARNSGLDAADGKYIIHIDSDDWVEPNLVSECVEKAEEADADIVAFGIAHEYNHRTVNDLKSVLVVDTMDKEEYLRSVITQTVSSTVCGKMYKKNLYINNGIRSIEGVNYAEDYAVYPLLAYRAKKIVGVRKMLYHYDRTNEISYTHVFKQIQLNNIMAAYHNVVNGLSKEYYFEKALGVQLLQIYSWARRKTILAHVNRDNVISETGELNVKFNYWGALSINHKIIIGLDFLHLYCLTCIYVLISEKIGERFKNKI